MEACCFFCIPYALDGGTYGSRRLGSGVMTPPYTHLGQRTFREVHMEIGGIHSVRGINLLYVLFVLDKLRRRRYNLDAKTFGLVAQLG